MGVKSLGYVVIETRDPGAWDRFMTEVVGLMPAPAVGETARCYRMDARPFRFRIEQGDSEKLVAPGWDMGGQASFDAAVDALRAAGRPVTLADEASAATRGVARLARSSDPVGNVFEIFHGDTRDDVPFVSPAGVSGFVTDGDDAMGMGHAVIAAPDFAPTHAFYRDVLGFGDSDLPHFHFNGGGPDDPGMRFAFMHAENGRHHSLALGEMPTPPSGCIHLMIEARTLEDVGRAYDRMRLAGVPVAATLGKHVNDEVTGFYMQTPGGFDLEFGWQGLVIDPATWTPTAHQQVSEWGHVWAWQAAMEAASK